MQQNTFEIAGWQVHPLLNRIAGPEGEVALEPRMMRVLVYLAEHPGEVVRREELLDTVWAGAIVTENSLTNSISALRKLLGDDPRQPQIIETIRGVGYRLVAPVVRPSSALPYQHGDGLPEVVALDVSVATGRSIAPWGWGLSLVLLGAVGYLGWTANTPSSMRIQPLTSLPGPELNPRFSPDGTQIAFVQLGPQGADLYVQSVDGETLVQLTDGPGAELSLAWTPDGTELTFFSYAPTGCGIHTISSAGGAARQRLETSCSVSGLHWHPDGQWLAFSEVDTVIGTRRIFLMDAQMQTRVPITNPSATSVGDFSPVFSPDGQTILFARSLVGGFSDLYTRPASTNPVTPLRLTHDAVSIMGYDWTPNGEEVVFTSHRAQTSGVWRIPFTGGTPRLVRAVSVEDPGRVVLSRTTADMAYVQWTYQVNLHHRNLETAETIPFAASTRTDAFPRYAPQGDRVAFVSSRTGPSEIWIQDVNATQPQRLTHLETTQLSLPSWSPDGQWLAFAADTGTGQWDAYVVSADGGTPRIISQTESNEVAPGWSADGQRLYFGSDRSGAWQIWQQSVIAGEAEQVTADGGYAARAHPDGQTLFYTKPRARGLWRKDFSTGAESAYLPQADAYLWEVNRQGLYFVTKPNLLADAELYRRDYPSEATVKITTWPTRPDAPFARWGMSVSPDEQSVLIGVVDQNESDIMLVTPF